MTFILSLLFSQAMRKLGRSDKEGGLSIANSPQRLLPLISTVTTATTSKSGSREPDLFFHFYFQNRILYIVFSFFSLNYYV